MTTRWWVQPGETLWRDVERHALYREEHELARASFLFDDGTQWGLRVTKGNKHDDGLFWDHRAQSFTAMHGGEILEHAKLTKLREELVRRSAPLSIAANEQAILDLVAERMRERDFTRGSGRLTERPPVIHRDLCPPNILIGLSGVSYLTDFGIAKAIESASLKPSLRGAGRVAYTAPERLMRGRDYDARADLFSLGVVLFEALTNERPSHARSIAAHIDHVLGGHRPRVEALRAEYHPSMGIAVPDGLEQLVVIVRRLLEPDPDDRYASASELVDALGQIHVPAEAHRELVMAAEDHMPAWRRKIRLRTGEMQKVAPAPPKPLWSSTDAQRLTSLLRTEWFDEERDTIRVSPEGGGPDTTPPRQ